MVEGPDLAGELIDRRFRVMHRIGSGGMGTVWEVRHVESLQRFALKTLAPDLAVDEQAVGRFLREARAAALLRTRHVVRIIDTQVGYEHSGRPLPFIVMELLEGESLEQLLARRGRLEPGELVWVFQQVSRALDVAHASGIIHRDLKPANVFVAADEEGAPIVKVCDFGVAKLVGDTAVRLARTNEAMTETGAVFGTPLYMAPEQLRSASRAEPATDQWPLGMMAFRALAGLDYFGDVPSPTELVLKIAQDSMPAPSALAPALERGFDAWFLRACDRNAAGRFDDTGELVQALAAALGHPEPRLVQPGSLPMPPAEFPDAPALLSDRKRAKTDSPWRPASVAGLTVATLVAVVVGHTLTAGWLERTLAASFGGTRSVASSSAEQGSAEASGEAPVRGEPAVVPVPDETSVKRSDEAPRTTPTLPEPPEQAPERSPAPPVRPPDTVRTAPPSPPPAPSPSPRGPSPPKRLESGEACERSAQCASGLCVAETCR